jgi:hypothetical protein
MTEKYRTFLCWLVVIGCSTETSKPAAALAASAAGVASPLDSLDRLDARKGVPLLPMMANHQKQNMRDHLVAVQQIVTGLAGDDFEAIEQAASRIGSSEQMGQMCTHMGSGAPGFTEQALHFHRTADTIMSAARQRNRGAVLTALGGTLQTCTSCHAAWKQQVVDERTWAQSTSTSPPAPDHHGGQP